MGRPRLEFNQKVADRICSLIAEGRSLRHICTMKAMPSMRTVLKWLDETPPFAVQYARAREEQAEGYADQLVELSRKATAENAHAIRVQVDVIKWVCSKLKPRKFGDRIELAGAVDIGARPERKPVSQLSGLERTQAGKRVVFEMVLLGQQLRDEWGQPEIAEALAFLADRTWKTISGTENQRAHRAPAALPAPAEQGRVLEPDPPRPEPEPDEVLPHYPSKDEMGLA